jgi:hypothetical protein
MVHSRDGLHFPLVPAKAGTQFVAPCCRNWIPACAGMSGVLRSDQSEAL